MARAPIDLGSGDALLNLRSFGRAARLTLTRKQAQTIAHTVKRAPEVMVKVSGGARSLGGVQAHFAYIGRDGELDVEVDHGFQFAGKGFEKQLVPDWDLDLLAHRRQDERSILGKRRAPKLVHNLIFSMPPGTPPKKVLAAVRKLAVNELAFRHRYALVLHTDEAHPHVHLVVKAESEQGERLNIRKATLRQWRQQFAENLRELGVSANATERAVRGEIRTPKKDGIYRAAQRKESTRQSEELHELRARSEPAVRRFVQGAHKLEHTRAAVVTGWRAIASDLEERGEFKLANDVHDFIARMPPPLTDQAQLIHSFLSRGRGPRVDPMERTL